VIMALAFKLCSGLFNHVSNHTYVCMTFKSSIDGKRVTSGISPLRGDFNEEKTVR
jgi:hypothetical protein